MSTTPVRVFCLLLATLCAVVETECAVSANLVRNGDFETVAEGIPSSWQGLGRHGAGDGRSLTGALAFASTNGVRTQLSEQELALKGGCRYKAVCWIRTEDIVGDGGGRVSLEAFDRDGKSVGRWRTRTVRDTLARYIDLELLAEMPLAACRFVLRLESADCAGRIWFDDVSVTRVVSDKYLGHFVTSAYRNTAASGKVTFTVPLTVDADTCVRMGLRGVFRVPTGTGWLKDVAVPVADGAAQLTIPVDALPMGRHPVQFGLVDKDGRELAWCERIFDRVTRLPGKGVWFDGQHRTMVDGKRFFPLGWFVSTRIDGAFIADLKKGGFNCAMSYSMPTPEVMDLCDRENIKVIFNLTGTYAPRDDVAPLKTMRDEKAYLTWKIGQMGTHPSLLAWYTCDERPPEWAERLTDRRNLLNGFDPLHPVWTVQYQLSQDGEYRAYLGTYDVAGSDPYPINWSGVRENIAMPSERTRRTRRDSFASSPIWQVPQFFDPGAYHASRMSRSRPPTERELSCMCWQCIAEGANGLVAYSYTGLRMMDARDPFERKWAEACRVGREISGRFALLLSDDVTDRATSDPRFTRVRVWDGPDGPTALVVNACYGPRRMSFTFDGRSYAVDLDPLGYAFVACGK